jgi:hypothetical protein
MRQPGTAVDALVYEDLLSSDFRVAINYFLCHGKV